MEILQPTFGLFFWSLLIFITFFFLLKKFAWKPILGMLDERETAIENSLKEAAKARDEMKNLTAQNQQLLKQAKDEREVILKEARETREQIVAKAREEATAESQRLITKARQEIQSEKMAAITEIKNQVGKLSIQIAEKVIRKEMENKGEQTRVVDNLIAELHMN